MAMTIRVDIVSAEAEIYSGQATMLFASAEMGEVGISPRHAPLVTRLKPGDVRVQKDNGEEEMFYVSGGILEVQPHHVTVLSDTAIRARDLDEAAAQQAKKDAEERIAHQQDEYDYARARAELAEAAAQLQTIRKLRRGGRA
ncbi:MAG: F0F1 ATP synthase subunit epsilon [Halofilum sp. (in: g-proteobacteria)]|nr:F0F1 ATP synthase subunit epsilon [Halofilum sp. (in: g-proteobacteria)]